MSFIGTPMTTPEDFRNHFQIIMNRVMRSTDLECPRVSCFTPGYVGGTYVAFDTVNDRFFVQRLTRETRAALAECGAVIVGSEITWNYDEVAAVWKAALDVIGPRLPLEVYRIIDRLAMYQQGFVVYFTTVSPTCVNRGEIYPARATVSHMTALADINRDAAMRMAQLMHPNALF